MKTKAQLSEALQIAFERPTHGVVGLVDELLKLCPAQGIQLDWHEERCRVRSAADDSEVLLNWPVPKSVFRGILARVASLCNEQGAKPVSPYGGQSELIVDTDPRVILTVTLANTLGEQKIQLIPVPSRGREFQTSGERECLGR